MARASAGVVALGVGVVAVVAGWFIWQGQKEPPEPAGTEEAQPAAASAPEPAPAPSTEPASLPPEPPRFDVVRVDGAGLATIAGSAAPEAEVALRLDGAEVGRAKADAGGQFAALITLSPSEAPRVLSLAMLLADGAEVAGVETVVIAPVAAPAAVDAAGTETAASEPATEPVAPAALLVSPEGVEVLSPAPQPEAAVSIDSIAYAPDGKVLVGGRAGAGASLRLYLDDAPLADLVAGTDGSWKAELPEVPPGVHSLRADQLDPTGKVTARFETPFKREAPEALAELAATPPAPAADAPAPAVAPAEPTPVETAGAEPAPAVPPATVSITVQPGYTLWGIAETAFGEGVLYVQVFEANKDKIKDPDLIYPGQVFTVPAAP